MLFIAPAIWLDLDRLQNWRERGQQSPAPGRLVPKSS